MTNIDGNDIWEALFSILKGEVPDALTEDVLSALATALATARVKELDGAGVAETQADEYIGLAVWCTLIADQHADVLTPRQIEKLYAANDALRLSATTPPEPEPVDELEAVARAIHEADPNVGVSWSEWVAYAELHPSHMQSVDFVRRQARAAITAQRGAAK